MTQPTRRPVEQTVRTYKGGFYFVWWTTPERRMRKDAARLAEQGWRVVSQTARRSPFITGQSVTVTYQRARITERDEARTLARQVLRDTRLDRTY